MSSSPQQRHQQRKTWDIRPGRSGVWKHSRVSGLGLRPHPHCQNHAVVLEIGCPQSSGSELCSQLLLACPCRAFGVPSNGFWSSPLSVIGFYYSGYLSANSLHILGIYQRIHRISCPFISEFTAYLGHISANSLHILGIIRLGSLLLLLDPDLHYCHWISPQSGRNDKLPCRFSLSLPMLQFTRMLKMKTGLSNADALHFLGVSLASVQGSLLTWPTLKTRNLEFSTPGRIAARGVGTVVTVAREQCTASAIMVLREQSHHHARPRCSRDPRSRSSSWWDSSIFFAWSGWRCSSAGRGGEKTGDDVLSLQKLVVAATSNMSQRQDVRDRVSPWGSAFNIGTLKVIKWFLRFFLFDLSAFACLCLVSLYLCFLSHDLRILYINLIGSVITLIRSALIVADGYADIHSTTWEHFFCQFCEGSSNKR